MFQVFSKPSYFQLFPYISIAHLLPQFWQGSCTSVSSRKCQAHTWVKQLACIGQRFVAILFGTGCPMITLTHRNSIFRQNHIEAYWSNFAEILALLWLSMVFRCRMVSCSMNVCTSSSTAQPAAGAKLLRFAIAETEPAWICSCVKGFCSKYMGGGGRAATKNIRFNDRLKLNVWTYGSSSHRKAVDKE